ncbi:hypothetical protein BJ878DRAFT_531955 [Calycina marina]|uniref:Phosphotransferase n=1 Tax=Calycina marina TaxID=1763456 RepID=A0A9P8CJ01_9HELO|nr:hypothetical protein BJ878DRAFT_531955 [Calycina marina]
MQPLIAAMIKVRQVFYAAFLKSLLRTKSWLQTILKFWISPNVINGQNEDDFGEMAGEQRAQFLEQVKTLFARDTRIQPLLKFSQRMTKELEGSLLDHPMNMLPSYNHLLPTGNERGSYLALDVGGSTFRVALIELSGTGADGGCKILRTKSIKIDSGIRQLQGSLFFDWMAQRIGETLAGQAEGKDMSAAPLSMGLSWSFPIEQTSLRGGRLLGMGKGFMAAQGLLGQDLGNLIQSACSRHSLNVELNAIVNDSSATLLSKAYLDPGTRFGLILGTGVNAAVHLPVHIFSAQKFGIRPTTWHESAKHVIVNTELSMFGGGYLPYTKWDKLLLSTHACPDFQPFEHFASGGYLGEITRLVLVEGVQTSGLLAGVLPQSLEKTYSLETETISRIASDKSLTLKGASDIFSSRHPSSHTPTVADLKALQQIAACITQRAAGLVAAGVYALWALRNDAENIDILDCEQTLVAYNGAVLENYPGFRETCQQQLDNLVGASGGKTGVIKLVYAEESSLIGAAIAVACLEG